MDKFQKFRKLDINAALISLEYSEIGFPYFCYPINAKVIGFEGSILYCFLPEYGETVFAANPESCADKYVYPLAENFEYFLSLILACGTANPIEQIIWMNKEQFEEHMREEAEHQTDEQRYILNLIQKEFGLTPMAKPFEYVKAIQRDFDDSRIQYSEEYYDVLGIENPQADSDSANINSFEFETVEFKIKK